MGRIKPTPTLITRSQVDTHLQRYALILDERERIRAEYDGQINALRQRMEVALAPLDIEAAQIETEINHHIRTYSADFTEPKRTITLRFGRIGIRKIRKDALQIVNRLRAAIIARLRELGMTDCIIEKPTIDARRLAEYSDEAIAKIEGVSRPAETEEPWFEAIREPIDPEAK